LKPRDLPPAGGHDEAGDDQQKADEQVDVAQGWNGQSSPTGGHIKHHDPQQAQQH